MRIQARVTTGARTESVERSENGTYKVRVRAAREKGKANEQVCDLLADYFGVSKSSVTIERGHRGRVKIIHIGT